TAEPSAPTGSRTAPSARPCMRTTGTPPTPCATASARLDDRRPRRPQEDTDRKADGVTESRMLRRIGTRDFDFSRQVAVMAVINRTPDSFYDKGATFALDRAVESALRAGDQGADWVDIGGVPFGRGPAVSTAEEIDRVVPVVAAITAARPELVISVDTNDADVAEQAIAAGAAVINDTSGLGDPRMADVLARSQAHVVITHRVGPPRVEKPAARYDDVGGEVRAFLVERMARAEAAGVSRDRLIIDPGHDLDKNTLHTLEITRRLDEIASIGAPLLVAVSNKDFI